MRPVLSEASLLDGLEQAVVVTDLTATIVFWNAAAESLYGWTRDDAIGRPVFEVTPTAASRRQGEEIFEAVRLGRRWSGDYPVQRRDGSTFLAQVTLTPVHDDKGNHVAVLGVSQDVTDARLMEAQASDSADRLQLAVDAVHLGCWQWTRATGQVRWDETMERVFGLAPGSFPGTLDAWFDLVYPDDRAKVLGMHDDVVTGGASHHRFDYRVVAPDGQLRRVEGRGRVLRTADGKVLGSVGYVHAVGEMRATLR